MVRLRAFTAVLLFLFTASAFAVLQLPPNQTVEASGPAGAVVNFNAGASGSGDDENGRPIDSATCSPASGSTFPLGTTTVNCTASSGGTGSFEVNVVDTRGPSLHLPRNFSVPAANANGANVSFLASASDIVDGNVSVSCSPGSGSFFSVGTTTVLCSASDSRQNESVGAFDVTVIAQPPPPEPHDDMTVEATGPNGAVVTYSSGGPGDGDDENGRPIGSSNCSPASGSTFPLGVTTVHCSDNTSFTVTVVDTTAPALSLPADIHQQTSDPNGATVNYSASASDLVDGSVAVNCTPASGSNFPVGTTTVQCSASDSRGNSAGGSFDVTIELTDTPDNEAPVIVSISASPDTLTPPNKKPRSVTLTVEVTDNLDATPLVRIFDVTADETITDDDWDITGLLTVDLNADRDPQGDGRVYTVHVEAIDDAGNRSVSSVNVTVPHDAGNNSRLPTPKQNPTLGRSSH